MLSLVKSCLEHDFRIALSAQIFTVLSVNYLLFLSSECQNNSPLQPAESLSGIFWGTVWRNITI